MPGDNRQLESGRAHFRAAPGNSKGFAMRLLSSGQEFEASPVTQTTYIETLPGNLYFSSSVRTQSQGENFSRHERLMVSFVTPTLELQYITLMGAQVVSFREAETPSDSPYVQRWCEVKSTHDY